LSAICSTVHEEPSTDSRGFSAIAAHAHHFHQSDDGGADGSGDQQRLDGLVLNVAAGGLDGLLAAVTQDGGLLAGGVVAIAGVATGTLADARQKRLGIAVGAGRPSTALSMAAWASRSAALRAAAARLKCSEVVALVAFDSSDMWAPRGLDFAAATRGSAEALKRRLQFARQAGSPR